MNWDSKYLPCCKYFESYSILRYCIQKELFFGAFQRINKVEQGENNSLDCLFKWERNTSCWQILLMNNGKKLFYLYYNSTLVYWKIDTLGIYTNIILQFKCCQHDRKIFDDSWIRKQNIYTPNIWGNSYYNSTLLYWKIVTLGIYRKTIV